MLNVLGSFLSYPENLYAFKLKINVITGKYVIYTVQDAKYSILKLNSNVLAKTLTFVTIF